MVAQGGGVAEADLAGDPVDGVVGLLEQLLRRADPLPQDPAVGRGSGLLLEAAGEGARGHVHVAGERLDVQVVAQVLADPRQQRGQRLRLADRHGAGDVLGLAAVTVGRHDHPPGGGGRDLGAEVLAHHVQRRIEARSGPGTGHDRAVLDVEHVAVDGGLGEPGRQLGDVAPVRRGPTTVEQAGLADHERGRAVAEDEPAAGVDRADQLDHLRRGLEVATLGDQADEVGVGRVVERVVDVQVVARRALHPAGAGRGDEEVEHRVVVLGVVGLPPHLAHRAQPERLGPVLHHGDDLLHGPSVHHPWQ